MSAIEIALAGRSLSPQRRSVPPSGKVAPFPDIDLARARRILVVKLDHIGDWILVTPFLENLARNAPNATIDALVLAPSLELATTCRHLERAIAVTKTQRDRFWYRASSDADALAFQRDYVAGGYDLAIVPRWDADFDGAARIACGSSAPVVIGFSEHCTRRKRILDRGADACFTHVLDDFRKVHEVEHNLALIEAMGGRVTTSALDLAVPAADRQIAERFLSHANADRHLPVLGIAPFATEPKRNIPLDRMVAVARSVASRCACRIVVLGGNADRLAGARLARMLGPQAQSAAGHLTIRQTAALIAECDALIAADAAPAHIAAAVKTPVAVLSCHPSSGSPLHANAPQRFAPWGDPVRIRMLQPTRASKPCQGCCCAGEPHCILSIDAAALAQAADFIARALNARHSLEMGAGQRSARASAAT